jgi:hypothetical protein
MPTYRPPSGRPADGAGAHLSRSTVTQQGIYGPPPTRRPSTPVPPLPAYGGRPLPPVPNRPAAYSRPAPPTVERPVVYHPADGGWDRPYTDDSYDDGYAPRYDDGWAQQEYDEYDEYDDEYDDYDEPFDEPPARTNTMAILGLVFAFVCAPLGLIFSAIGLGQSKRRREGGRGLAITGLVLSIVFLLVGIAFAVFVFLGAGKALQAVATGQLPSQPVAPGQADTGPDSVLTACQAIMPSFTGLEQQMSTATSPDQAAQSLAAVRTQMTGAIASTSDPAFVQQVQKLAADIQQLETAMATGQVPAGIETTMANDGYAVGQSCGLAGWTP